MIKRVLNFGCSHAFGTEMAGKKNDEGSYDLNFGKHVADHFGVEFVRFGHPGSGNKFAYHNMIEFVQEGDLVLNSGCQIQRFMYYQTSYDKNIGSSHLTPYEITKVAELLYDKVKLMDYMKVTPVLQILGLLDEHHKYIKSAGINFIDYGNTQVAQKITEWAMNYHYEFLPLFVDYLEIYNAQLNLCEARGAKIINWIAQEDKDYLMWMENYNEDVKLYKHSPRNHLPKTLNEGKLYSVWKNDPTRIKPTAEEGDWVGLLEVLHRRLGGEPWELPDGRMGHYGPDVHKALADLLIAKAEELGYG